MVIEGYLCAARFRAHHNGNAGSQGREGIQAVVHLDAVGIGVQGGRAVAGDLQGEDIT
jgi:hypothetical protein